MQETISQKNEKLSQENEQLSQENEQLAQENEQLQKNVLELMVYINQLLQQQSLEPQTQPPQQSLETQPPQQSLETQPRPLEPQAQPLQQSLETQAQPLQQSQLQPPQLQPPQPAQPNRVRHIIENINSTIYGFFNPLNKKITSCEDDIEYSVTGFCVHHYNERGCKTKNGKEIKSKKGWDEVEIEISADEWISLRTHSNS